MFYSLVPEFVTSYSVVQHGVRVPRVAVLFPGGSDWGDWARLGLYAASHIWGGSGFVLVPHRDGEVTPALLEMVSVYDPDYVVSLAPTIAQLERVRPGSLRLPRLDGVDSEAESTARIPKYLKDDVPDMRRLDPGGERARQRVIEVCAPYSMRVEGGQPYQEPVQLTPMARSRRLTVLTDLSDVPVEACLSAGPCWTGAAGLAAGLRFGLMEAPRPPFRADNGAGDRHATPEPNVDYSMLSWLLRPERGETTLPLSAAWQPVITAGVDPRRLPLAFDRTEHGLGWVTQGPAGRETLVVVGDTASDFALALGWDRIYGSGVWLPDEWCGNLSADCDPARQVLDDLVTDTRRRSAGQVRVVSTTVGSKRLDTILDALRAPLHPQRVGSGDLNVKQRAEQAATVTSGPVSWPRSGLRHLGIGDQFDERSPLPVQRATDETVTLLVPPPSPLLRDPMLQASVGLDWEVDLSIPDTVMPSGRGLPGEALLAPEESPYLTWVRPSRSHISFQAQRYDLVIRGTAPASQLAQPRLRSLGLLEWAVTMAKETGLEVRFSQAGSRVEVLRRMWGSRQALAELLAGPMLTALQAFNAKSRSSSVAYPDGNGVVAGGEGYLSLVDLQQRTSAFTVAQLRDQVDALTARRILRRGHLLSCAACGRWTFYDVDRLQQTNTCPRCDSANEFVRQRWKGGHEPTWFYDLHPIARDLLAQDGDVPLLLAHHLHGSTSQYADLAEIELVEEGEAVAECDLVASVDSEVVIAEAKTVDRLAKTRRKTVDAIAKRIRLAQVLHADQVVLATAAPNWNATDINQLKAAIANAAWPIKPPAIRIITGLRSGEVADVRM